MEEKHVGATIGRPQAFNERPLQNNIKLPYEKKPRTGGAFSLAFLRESVYNVVV